MNGLFGRLPACRGLAAGVLTGALLCMCLSPGAHADNNSGGFVIRTAYTELLNGVYYLSADVDLNMSGKVLNALENGVPLTVEWQIQVIHPRFLLWNQTVATLTERYQISYHPLTQRFVIKNLNS
ncbi:MAG: DUF4390 domain-containing protein, partial [Gammaproteobacteria bacterium]|nr:DUF4390 domain-containing protein [Gammaproteobacteria bacterium]